MFNFKVVPLVIIMLSFFSVSSCKKSNTTHVKTTAEKLDGKWQLVSLNSNTFYDNTDHKDTESFDSSAYYEFMSNGTLYTSIMGGTNNTTYTVLNDTSILIVPNNAPTIIKILTDHSLQLYFYYHPLANDLSRYNETYYNFIR